VKSHFKRLARGGARGGAGRALRDFAMIEDNDGALVCVADGKDSHAMADRLWDMKCRAHHRVDAGERAKQEGANSAF